MTAGERCRSGRGIANLVGGMVAAPCFDVIVVGSGAAGLSAALAAAVSGARVLVAEKAPVLGGTTAMSGGCIWVPNHHHQAAISVTDSKEAALDYIRTISPEGWHNQEEPLWVAFVINASKMLKFVEGNNSAGTRVRKYMQSIKNLAQEVRKEVQNQKNAVVA